MEKIQVSPSDISRVDPNYFELQAYWGGTKHMGGMKSTRKLIDACHINKDSYVLDVGCGTGATPSFLARRMGCRVMGIDLREAMIARAREKTQRDHVFDRVELRTGDVQELAFQDGTFDAVIAESVLTFVPDKARALEECVRVCRVGGYVGLNEEVWIRPPTPELVKYAAKAWDVHAEILTGEGWEALMAQAGLCNLVGLTFKFGAFFGEYISEITRYRPREYLSMVSRAIALYARNPRFRKYMRGRYASLPKGFFEYLGYGIFVGRKYRGYGTP